MGRLVCKSSENLKLNIRVLVYNQFPSVCLQSNSILNFGVEWLQFLLRMKVVRDSNLSPGGGYPHEGFGSV
jgi:hypothetical protein